MNKCMFACLILLLSVSYILPTADAQTTAPVNPNADNSTGNILNWLAHLPNRPNNRVVSGHFAGYSYNSFSMAETDRIAQQTGQYPAILSCDYGAGYATSSNPLNLINYTCNSSLIPYAANGGLITISTHYPNPANPHGGGLNDKGSLQFSDLLNPDTETGARWRQYLDKTADGLKELQNAGITVLWRPFHEMNGTWFWWNNQDPAVFKSVWIDMYHYFTDTKGLNNLLWIYAPDAGQTKKTDYYPGNEYVDIVGLDAYSDAPSSLGFSGYNEMLGLGKPFAFAEIGPKSTTKTFDYSLWATAIKQNYPETVYFLAWSGSYSPANNVNSSGLMNDAWVVNRGEVDLGSVTEAVYINDDFNSLTVGSVPEGWTIAAPASTSVSIQDIPNAADKSAVLSDRSVSASVYMKKGFTARSRNTDVEFTFKTGSGGSSSSFYVSKAANPAANLGLDASGNLIYRTSTGSTVVQFLSPDTWYSVKLLVKPSIRKYDIYIDGTLKASNVPFYANVNWLDNVKVETGVSSTGDLYLSGINVNPSN